MFLPVYIFSIILSLFPPVKAEARMAVGEVPFMDGDVVVREGRGMISSFFKSFSRQEKKYSHAGLIKMSGGRAFVCHFMEGGYAVEPFENFIDRTQTKSYAVYRYPVSCCQRKMLSVQMIDESLSQKTFDPDFNLQSDDAMYCTEWIYKCMKGINLSLPVTIIEGEPYVAVDNLYYDVDALPIIKAQYEEI